MSQEASRRVGDYEVLDELGSGGMGRVFRVRNVISDRIEAMKILLPDLVGRQELASRFLREIKVLGSLNHPNIAALRTALTVDNQLVMIMEYVEGVSLDKRLAHGPIAMADALNYIDQILDALSYAHQQHVIHRDIKPANMMLTPRGVVKLMDFGIARSGEDRTLTMTGTAPGSLSYMSPEQVRGENVGPRSDLYSVGISLYEMVTGLRPFRGDSDYEIMSAQIKQTPKPPIELQTSLPSELNDIIMTVIEKDPERRFHSADAFRNALSKVPGGTTNPRPATTARQATMVDSAAVMSLPKGAADAAETQWQTSAGPLPSNHALTIVDTHAPSNPSLNASPPTNAPPNPAEQPPVRNSHRFLYMALGAVAVIALMIGIGIYSRKAEADPKTTTTETAHEGEKAPAAKETAATVTETAATVTETGKTPTETVTTATGGAPSKSGAEATAANAEAPPRPDAPSANSRRPDATATTVGNSTAKSKVSGSSAVQTTAGGGDTSTPTAAQSGRELDELERDVDQLTARVASVNSSLDRLQDQQARQGLGLRGDMAGRQQSMKVNLSKAQDAVTRSDAARAKRYKEATESDLEALEKFLGR
jgi:serine/threonine protein kinase